MSKQHMNTSCQNFPFASINVSDIFFSTFLVNSVYDLKRWEALCLHLCLAAVCQIMSNYWQCFFFWFGWLFLLHDGMKDCFPFLFSLLLLLLLKLSLHRLLREKEGDFLQLVPMKSPSPSLLPAPGGQSS